MVIFRGFFISCHAADATEPEADKVRARASSLLSVFIGGNKSNLACRWTHIQVRELSINISYRSRSFHRDTQHEYSSVPQHASPQHCLSVSLSLSRVNIKTPQPGGVASHVCDSYFTVSSKISFFIISSYLVHKLMVTLKPQLVGGVVPAVASTEEALLRDGSMKRFNLGGMSVRVDVLLRFLLKLCSGSKPVSCCSSVWSGWRVSKLGCCMTATQPDLEIEMVM